MTPGKLHAPGAGRARAAPEAPLPGASATTKGEALTPRDTRMQPIYLDYNATTPIDPAVLEAMLPYLRAEFGNPSSAHTYGKAAHDAVDRARQQVADFLGA